MRCHCPNRDARRAAVVAGMFSPPDVNPDNPAAVSAAALRQALASITRFMRDIGRAVQRMMDSITRGFRPLYEHLRALDLVPPADLPGRALWLRQHRSTGPDWPRMRPPRRLDPSGLAPAG